MQKLFEHDQRFQLVRRDEKRVTRDDLQRVLTAMDQQTVILPRLDQERVFTNERIRRMQQQLDEQQEAINQIKQVLKVA